MPAPKSIKSRKAAEPMPLIGHRQIFDFLCHSHSSGRLAHAYLLSGPDGVGKATLARAFAAWLFGVERPEIHPDFLAVVRGNDPKTGKAHKEIVLDQVQQLVGWLALGAFAGGWKIVLLEDAQHLNREAANALLKGLEEPKEKTLLLLTADSPDNVMPTVRSRCQLLAFGRVPAPAIAAALCERGEAAEHADLLARLASGCPGRAFALAAEPKRLDDLRDRRERLLAAIEQGTAERWMALEKLIPEKLSFNEATEQAGSVLDLLEELLRDALLIAGGRPEVVTHLDVEPRLRAWVGSVGLAGAAVALDAAAETRRLLAENIGARTAFGQLAVAFQ